MRVVCLLLVGAVTSLSALVSAYHVDPKTAAMSGKARPDLGVSEILTCNFDELDSASSGYVELFAGFHGAGANYHLDIYEQPNGPRVAYRHDVVPGRDHTWLRFDRIRMETGRSFTKGKQYEFRFTRAGSDSIQYYYDSDCGYHYGQMIAPYPPMITPSYGLAMRCLGRMRPVDSTYFGADEVGWRWHPSFNFDTFKCRVETSKVRAMRFDLDWDSIQAGGMNSWDWTIVDSTLRGILADDSMCKPLALVTLTPLWASSRWDSMDFFGAMCTVAAWTPHCAPRGLDYPITSDFNFLARFIDAAVHHFDDSESIAVHDWEVGNEQNDTTTIPDYPNSVHHYAGWWRRPNRAYDTLGSGLRPLCALYMRMAQVVDSVLKHTDHPGHEADKVAIGSMASVFRIDTAGVVAGKDWLDNCYAAASENDWGIFWDAVSVHDYQGGDHFVPETLRVHAETLRATMRKWGDADGELWNTEFGWNNIPSGYQPEQDARNLCEAFVSHKASEASPGGGYDRLYWWYFHRPYTWNAYGLVNSALVRQEPFYAMKQVAGGLTGKQFNGRVMTGDTAIDNHTRIYELEDTSTLKKRTWVCWQDEAVTAYTPVPVRNDTVDTVALAYNGSPPAHQKGAENSGWLHVALDPRPAFVTEKSAASRPDLVVDSVKYTLRAPDTVLAWVTNRGNRATPRQSPGNQPYPTWAVLYANGDSLTQQVWADSIGVNQQVTFRFNLVVAQPLPVLFAVKVNPTQTYVELGTDDNSGYRLKAQP